MKRREKDKLDEDECMWKGKNKAWKDLSGMFAFYVYYVCVLYVLCFLCLPYTRLCLQVKGLDPKLVETILNEVVPKSLTGINFKDVSGQNKVSVLCVLTTKCPSP
jgi:hypothetical protein